MKPQHQLNIMVLTYAGQLAANEQYPTLLALGLRRDQIQQLQGMNFVDVTDMATSLNGILLEAKIDPEAFDIMLLVHQRRRLEREKAQNLIKAGASQRLMHELFGVDQHLYAGHREHLGLKGAGSGRCPEPDLETARAIWAAWIDSEDVNDEASRYLSVHEATGKPLRMIERVIRTSEMGAASPSAHSTEKRGQHIKTQAKGAAIHGY